MVTLAPTVREFLSGATTDAPVTLTTAPTTEAGWWLLAVQQWDWDPSDEQIPPSGTAPDSAWALVADSGPASDDYAHLKAWLRRVTTAGAQQVIFRNGGASDDNHARLWVLSGLRSTNPVLAASDYAHGFDPNGRVIAPSIGNPDGPALLIAAWIAGWDPGNYTGLPAGWTTNPELDAAYSTTLSATRTLTETGSTGEAVAVFDHPGTVWATITLLVRGAEPVPPPPAGPPGAPSLWATAVTTRVDPILDQPTSAGLRVATFQFDLVDALTGRTLGQIHPLRDPVPELSHDTSRTIPRQLKLQFNRDDTVIIDPIGHRIAVSMLLAGQVYPLGRYLIVDHTLSRTSAGPLAASALVDEMFLVDQPLTASFCPVTQSGLYATHLGIDQAINRLLRDLTLPTRIEATSASTAGTWPAGTSRAKVLADLALDGGYATPWVDHHGVLQMVQSVDPATAIPDLDLDLPGRVLDDSIAEVTDLLTAPNRFVVISNDAASTPTVGVYDLPPAAPNSAQRRGFVIPHVVERQVTDVRQATAVAETLARTMTVTERAELSTPPDPRHDGHTLVSWRGQRWIETSWSMQLTPGGTMRHVLKRTYP